MRSFAYIFAAFIVLAGLSACSSQPEPAKPEVGIPTATCPGPSARDDFAEVAGQFPNLKPPQFLRGRQARDFVDRTGGVEVRRMEWFHRVELVVVYRGVIQGAVLVGVYDKDECRLANGVFDEHQV
jgi:hypothetical protein